MVGLLISFIAMAVISYQDLKNRAIHWVTLPLLFGGLLWWKGFTSFTFIETGKNLLFIIAVLFFVTVYISLKHRSFQDITQSYFAWGDILFLLAITPVFTNQAFMLFFIGCTVVVLIISLLLMNMMSSFKLIPYAGLFALILNGFLLYSTFINNKTLHYLESKPLLIE